MASGDGGVNEEASVTSFGAHGREQAGIVSGEAARRSELAARTVPAQQPECDGREEFIMDDSPSLGSS